MSNNLIPPESIRTWVGPFKDADVFTKSGQQTFNILKEYANISPSQTILDAGCGCGRVALLLLHFLSDAGKYYGFDICPEHIDWCKKNISVSFPDFHFAHVDVKKKLYNPNGKYQLKEMTLPYSENMFDIVYAHSLFTHMVDHEMKYYINELSRVIKPTGTFYASYYLINSKTAEGVRKGTASFNFTHSIGECYTFDPENPEEGIAQSETFVRKIYDNCGFNIIEPIHYSDWDRIGIPDQDFIIAKRIK